MVALSETTSRSRVVPGLGWRSVILLRLTVVRLIGLRFSTVDLFFDEAQYWAWSREPAFGYFSKPPLLAWIIAVAEQVCGSSEACIRAPAPILYFGTSLLVYAVARQLYDARVAFFAALSIALATGAVFSARIISTDVPLLFFWALALLAYVKLLDDGGRALDRDARRRARPRPDGQVCDDLFRARRGAGRGWLDADARRLSAHAGAVARAARSPLVIVTPNIVWNLAATVSRHSSTPATTSKAAEWSSTRSRGSNSSSRSSRCSGRSCSRCCWSVIASHRLA